MGGVVHFASGALEVPNALGGRKRGELEAIVGLLEGVLQGVFVRDIGVDADPRPDGAVQPEARPGLGMQPAVDAIEPPDAEVELERGARPVGPGHQVADPRLILGMHAAAVGVGAELLQSLAGELQPVMHVRFRRIVGVPSPEERGGRMYEKPQAVLLFLIFLLFLAPLHGARLGT